MMDIMAMRRGNGLWLSIGAALTAMCAVLAYAVPDPVEAARLIIRVTARTSFALFLPVLCASLLHAFAPGALSRTLLALRRQLGLSFAVSHFLHLIAIITFYRLDPVAFWSITQMANIIGGGLTYLLIAAMTVTSFSPWREGVGPLLWSRLHTAGTWMIALTFLVSNAKRIVNHPGYAAPALLIAALLVARLYVTWRGRSAAAA